MTAPRFEDVPEIPKAEITLAWSNDYWDGPMSGACLYQGALHLFEYAGSNPDWDAYNDDEGNEKPTWFRRYWVLKITPEVEIEERTRHALFCKHVNTRFDYITPDLPKPTGEQHLFYDVYPPRRPRKPPEGAEIIGWFRR